MLTQLCKLLALLSLPALHRLGWLVGWLVHYCNPSAASLQRANLLQSGLVPDSAQLQPLLRRNIAETGKALVETLAIWGMRDSALPSLVKQVDGWHYVQAAQHKGKGIIFLTPHMGCFEIASLHYGAQYPFTVLYRPPKLKLLQPLIAQGRARMHITLAEANTGGVRKLMQALKRGEAIGILPDQIPAEGEGEWADFFGKPAYTMTLASKLAEKTGASVIMVFGERLANGAGYHLHLTQVDSIATPTLLNQAIEQQVKYMPAQYLWQYNRYKARRHAMHKLNAPQ